MKALAHHSLEMQAARRAAINELRRLGAPVNDSTTVARMSDMIAQLTSWPAPAKTPAAMLPFLTRFLDLHCASAVPPPYRPIVRRALRYDLAMRTVAARAAAAQPHLTHATSNVITWRELP